MRRLLRSVESLLQKHQPAEEINGGERCPTYLFRWELLSLLGGNCKVYLHKFVGDDWARDLHDHPKRFVSIGLSGWYMERYFDNATNEEKERLFTAPWIRTFPAEHRHRLMGPDHENPCWTLVIVGPASREWGFWSGGVNLIPWRDYVRHITDVACQ